VQRVERHIVLNNRNIEKLCTLSKNLYNVGNYNIRQEFINNGNWLRYQQLDKLLKETKDYKALSAQVAQQVLRLLDKNWISFFEANKRYNRDSKKFRSRPKLPRYKNKNTGKNMVVFTKQDARLKNGFICFPKKVNLEPLKTKVNNICQVRIVPQAVCYVIEVVYNKEAKNVKLQPNTYLSIDLGVNNFATCVNNIGLKPFVVNGKILKSINQYFNKKKARLMSYVKDKGTSNKVDKLIHKRNCKVQDYLHKTSRFIVNYCIAYKIGVIIVGKNKDWKQEIDMGKKNNQNFVSIPFDTLVKQIRYKAEEAGIKIAVSEESYTSKCSFLDFEKVKKQVEYLGKRIKRGLFRSAEGILINADVNSAYNILKKVVPNAFANGIEGVGLHPIVIQLQ
jgi:putative transposase